MSPPAAPAIAWVERVSATTGAVTESAGLHRSSERLHAGDEHAEPREEEDVAGRAAAARVDRAHGERGRRAARPADAAVGRPGGPVVSGRGDEERVEGGGSRGSGRERAVGERGEGLDDADERDPGGVVGVTVLVRVDCELDPGQELVGAAVDGDAARRIGLPAGDADRKQRRSRRDPLQAGRSVGAGDEARHLGAVPLGPPRNGRVLTRARIADRVEDVEAAEQRAANVRMDESTPVSSSATVTPDPVRAGDADVGAPARRRRRRCVDGARVRRRPGSPCAPGRRPARRGSRWTIASDAWRRAAPQSR